MNFKFVLCLLMPLAALAADYQPEAWNLKARQEFASFKFGIFIHWGIYANYAQGEWYLVYGSKNGRTLEEEPYSRMMYGFYPSKFDAHEWCRIFADAGAKYVTITSRHHDGFSLWPTKADDGYNIAMTPFRRDILGELAAACRHEGLQINFYYSLLDWHRKDFPAGRSCKKVKGEQQGNYDSYKRFMLAQLTELIDNYHPGNIWFDGEWEHLKRDEKTHTFLKDGSTLDWGLDEIYDLLHAKHTLVANNNHLPIRPKEDIQPFERDVPGENTEGFSAGQVVARERPLEQCDVIQHNVWGYRIGETRFRTPEQICTMIVRCAAKNANLLMNIGPDGSGQLPARSVEILAEVGKWMRANGHAIYGTVNGPVQEKDRVSTKLGDRVYVFKLSDGKYPELEK